MLLSDQEIVSAIKNEQLKLKPAVDLSDPYSKDSAIQPGSLDLRVGEIFIPPDEPKDGTPTKVAGKGHVLRPGRTVVVATREEITLSSSMAAFGFPPTRLSSKGILMTNPGHVDPGFEGRLHFTLINMGHEEFDIIPGEPVVTLLLVAFEKSVERDYRARRKISSAGPSSGKASSARRTGEELAKGLAADFIGLERRAREVAGEEIRKAAIKAAWGPALFAVCGLALSTVGTCRGYAKHTDVVENRLSIRRLDKLKNELQEAKEKLADTQRQLELARLKADTASKFSNRLDEIDSRIKTFEKTRMRHGKGIRTRKTRD